MTHISFHGRVAIKQPVGYKPEVAYFISGTVAKDVRRFDIPMDHARVVNTSQSRARMGDDLAYFVKRHRVSLILSLERPPVAKLRDQMHDIVRIPEDLVDAYNILMLR